MKWLNGGANGYFRHRNRSCPGILLLLFCSLAPLIHLSAQCPPNLGFEKGTFDNWICSSGRIDSTGKISLSETGPVPGNHTLFKNTLPQQKDAFGGFPVTCPNGSGYSIMLGNSQTGAGADAISYTLTVPADKNSYSILYNYAVVFQNPDHSDYQQPRFTAKVFDIDANDYIACSSFDFAASSNLPGFKLAGSFSTGGNQGGQNPTSVYYKPWSPVTITLEGYAGKKLKLEFTVNDCTRGGHFGYAYLDVNEQCAGLIGGNVICAGYNSTTLVAPYGFQSYHWYNQDFTKLLGNENTLNLKPAPSANSVIALQVFPYAGSGCVDTLYTTMNYLNVPFTFKTIDTSSTCAPLTIDLTAARVTAGSTPGLSFSYYLDSTLNNYVPSAKTIDETGRYYIKATNEEGCIDVKSVSLTVDKIPEISISDPRPVYYPDKVDISNPALIKGDIDSLRFSYWKDALTSIRVPFAEAVDLTGTYYIRATTLFGCTDVYPVKVNILIPTPPNAFSPNGDGVHDTWQFPALSVYPQCRVDIFDRYGRLLFHSIGYEKPWDGKFNGQPLPVGTYYYVIKPSDKLGTMSGSITLLY